MKVTIAGGAGGVGASTAFNLVLMQGGQEIVLVDVRPEMITSHVMDLDQTVEVSPGCTVRGGDGADVLDADILVLISATPLTVGTSRLDYLTKNASIVDEVTNRLPAEWPGVLIVVTNPVDPLVTRIVRGTGIERRRVVGYTINDTLRLRTGLTKALGLAPGSVQAWVVGEHGDLSVPLYDRVTVDGVQVRPSDEQIAVAEEYRRTWYVRHVALDSGRSSTWTSGLGVARMVAAIAGGGGSSGRRPSSSRGNTASAVSRSACRSPSAAAAPSRSTNGISRPQTWLHCRRPPHSSGRLSTASSDGRAPARRSRGSPARHPRGGAAGHRPRSPRSSRPTVESGPDGR